jgi:hypothetical protein
MLDSLIFLHLLQLSGVVEELETKLDAAEQRASAAEAHVASIQDGLECREERASGMRQATVAAIKEVAALKQEIEVERQSIRRLITPALLKLTPPQERLNAMPLRKAVTAVVATAIEMHTDKAAAHREQTRLKKEVRTLKSQLASLHSVTQTVLDHAGAGEEATLRSLAQAHHRAAQLEVANKGLRQGAAHANAAATRDWTAMRTDMERIVAHAEQAQRDAELALHRQQSEAAGLKQQVETLQRCLQEAAREQSTEMPQLLGVVNQGVPPDRDGQQENQLSRELGDARRELASQAQVQGAVAHADELRYKLKAAQSELGATRREATAAEHRAGQLEVQLHTAMKLCKQQGEALKSAREDCDKV